MAEHRAKARKSRSIQWRIWLLVELFHGGSVNAASKVMGIPQPTLSRMVNEEAPPPRADLLPHIARAYGTTVDWLLTGEGEDPPASSFGDSFEQRHWEALVRSLDLDTRTESIVRALPLRIERAIADFGIAPSKSRPTKKLSLAMRREHSAWSSLVEEWIDLYGRDTVRASLQQRGKSLFGEGL